MKFLTAIVLSAVALVALGKPDGLDPRIPIKQACDKVEFPKVYVRNDKSDLCVGTLVNRCKKVNNHDSPNVPRYADVAPLNEVMTTLKTKTVDLETICKSYYNYYLDNRGVNKIH